MPDAPDTAKPDDGLPHCGYFVGKTVPAGCRGVIDHATRLAMALHEKHYPEVTGWQPARGNLSALLAQIDNMTAGLVRREKSDACCKECRFFLPQTKIGGQCRRHAQQPISWNDRDYNTGAVINYTSFDWPAMGNDQWCGDWEAEKPDA